VLFLQEPGAWESFQEQSRSFVFPPAHTKSPNLPAPIVEIANYDGTQLTNFDDVLAAFQHELVNTSDANAVDVNRFTVITIHALRADIWIS
jgi:hypothetical protein